MTRMTTTHGIDSSELARRAVLWMADGSPEDFRGMYHPEAVNREALAEPPECRRPGPEGFYATALWLRAAMDGLAFTVHDVVAQGDLVAASARMSGRHTGTMVTYNPDGTVDRAFAPTGKRFTVPQAHFIRLRDDLVVEHWAVRDDLGQAVQLGWVPPTPVYLVRCALATRAARRRLARDVAGAA